MTGGYEGRWQFAALHVLDLGGAPVAVQLLSSIRGSSVVAAHDLASGRQIGSEPMPYDHCFISPESNLFTIQAGGVSWVVMRGRGYDWDVWRLTPDGLRYAAAGPAAGHVAGADGVHELTPAMVGDVPAVLTSDGQRVRFWSVPGGEELRPPWVPPAGWQVEELVAARGRGYAWLEPTHRSWRGWLWDPVDGAPAGRSVLMCGPRWGLGQLAGRPALLVRLWPGYQVWDLALAGPVGGYLPDDVPASPTAIGLGSLHGRPVLTAGTGDSSPRIGVWDLGTGTRAYAAEVPTPPLASRTGPGGHLYVTAEDGSVTDLTVPARAIHPVVRRGRPCRCGHSRYATPRTQRDALVLARHWPVTDPPLELIQLDRARWLGVHRCSGCGRYWAEESVTSGHAELYYGYPIHTDDPHGWLARAGNLTLSR